MKVHYFDEKHEFVQMTKVDIGHKVTYFQYTTQLGHGSIFFKSNTLVMKT